MKKTKNELPKRLSSKQVFEAANAVWLNQPMIAEDIASESSKIIQSVFKETPMFFSGKSSKRVLSGLFYQLSLNTVNTKTQREIASALGTTELTTRMSYREWVNCFPKNFQKKSEAFTNRGHDLAKLL